MPDIKRLLNCRSLAGNGTIKRYLECDVIPPADSYVYGCNSLGEKRKQLYEEDVVVAIDTQMDEAASHFCRCGLGSCKRKKRMDSKGEF